MKNVIYISPLPWESFAQRPHKFVSWFREKYGGNALWVEPYATRYPTFSDIRRAITSSGSITSGNVPDWLDIVATKALPIEPFPRSEVVNNLLWRPVLERVKDFASGGDCLIAIGKPSALAVEALRILPNCRSLYDAMDNFPAFYNGFSKSALMRRERNLVEIVDTVWTSSTSLYDKWRNTAKHIALVNNALDDSAFASLDIQPINHGRRIFGYLGTVGQWFDWDMVVALANAVPNDIIRIIGPVFKYPSKPIPSNVELLPPCKHSHAMEELARFDVGLIPFLQNELTCSVDPIKFYEYRALEIPVISSRFGEMTYRGVADGVHLLRDINNLREVIDSAAKNIKPRKLDRDFADKNSWSYRFDQAKFSPDQSSR